MWTYIIKSARRHRARKVRLADEHVMSSRSCCHSYVKREVSGCCCRCFCCWNCSCNGGRALRWEADTIWAAGHMTKSNCLDLCLHILNEMLVWDAKCEEMALLLERNPATLDTHLSLRNFLLKSSVKCWQPQWGWLYNWDSDQEYWSDHGSDLEFWSDRNSGPEFWSDQESDLKFWSGQDSDLEFWSDQDPDPEFWSDQDSDPEFWSDQDSETELSSDQDQGLEFSSN